MSARKRVIRNNSTFLSISLAELYFFIIFQIGSVNIGKILYSYGANISAVDENGKTPLHVAAKAGKLLNFWLYLL